jgi:hypothetical protein
MLLPRYWAAAEQLLPQASLTELSLLLWARARLGCIPTSAWKQSFWTAAELALQASASGSQPAAKHQGHHEQPQQPSSPPPPTIATGAKTAPFSAVDSRWQVQTIVRLVWAAGKLTQQEAAGTSKLLLEACMTALPNCSYGALVSLGLSLLRLHRREQAALGIAERAAGAERLGGVLKPSSTPPGTASQPTTVQQATPFWQAWFQHSEQLLLQSSRFQRTQWQQHTIICARDLSTQLNVVWQLQLQPPRHWCTVAAQTVPSLSSTATFGQLSWLVCSVVKLQLQDLLPAGWAGHVLLMCFQTADVTPGNALQLVMQDISHRSSSSSSCKCLGVTSISSQAGSYYRLRRAFRALHNAGCMSVQEWQLWLQLQSKMCDRMGLLC